MNDKEEKKEKDEVDAVTVLRLVIVLIMMLLIKPPAFLTKTLFFLRVGPTLPPSLINQAS